MADGESSFDIYRLMVEYLTVNMIEYGKNHSYYIDIFGRLKKCEERSMVWHPISNKCDRMNEIHETNEMIEHNMNHMVVIIIFGSVLILIVVYCGCKQYNKSEMKQQQFNNSDYSDNRFLIHLINNLIMGSKQQVIEKQNFII
eukprot:357287_1